MTSYAIIGTGAIGGWCAIKLVQAGFAVHCLLNTDYAFVKEKGLTLVESEQATTLAINAYRDVNDMPTCDVILVTLKSTHNHLLKDLLPSLIHDKTAVILLQNGIGMEQEIAKFIEPSKIMGATCQLKVTKNSPGVITHYGLNSFELAQYYPDDYQKGITQQVQKIANEFIKACFHCSLAVHLPTIRWKKLAANMAVSGLSIVLNAALQELVENPGYFQRTCQITQEVITTAKQCGAEMPAEFYEYRLSVLQSYKKMAKSYPSMKLDFDAGRPLELQAIYANPINIAKQHSAVMPLTEELYLALLTKTQESS